MLLFFSNGLGETVHRHCFTLEEGGVRSSSGRVCLKYETHC